MEIEAVLTPASNLVDFPSNELWKAVRERDPKYYSSFVYAVKSTKIYCRPTCASRRPITQASVLFFSQPNEARAAGFRPCRRCRPDEELSPEVLKIQRLCEFIKENSAERLTLRRLSSEAQISPFHLLRTFKKVTGVTPREYTEAVRMDRLKLSLRAGTSVRKSTYEAGYNTSAWLYFRPEEKLGMSPLDYKRGGEGLSIGYAISDSPLGQLLVAATERGVCLVSLGESEQKLLSHLRAEFPNAKLESKTRDQNLSLSIEKLVDYLTNGTDLATSNLPLDIHVTAFQWKVYKALRAIPFGQVASYSDVAKKIGSPRAVRAVGTACASNPVPLIVPCHRVVPKSGGVGNYGLGVKRKRILLEKEGVDLSALQPK